MFSDSLLIWGESEDEIINQLQELYIKLISKGLLLRGAIVSGKLSFEPRITLTNNFTKSLPNDDTIARASGLEKTHKGARLLIENSLAERILGQNLDWLTHDGYLNNLKPEVSIDDMKRRICPTPNNKTYELLYFWFTNHLNELGDSLLDQIFKKLNELSNIYTDDIVVHYKETQRLFKRCQSRRDYTERELRRYR